MDKTIFYLGTCSTCNRIMKEIGVDDSWQLREIKTEPISINELEQLHKLAGTYEALFSRRAMKYRELGLNEKSLSESDYKQYILQEYTFLKRPVIVLNNTIFIGNSKRTIEQVKAAL